MTDQNGAHSRRDFLLGVLATGTLSAVATYFVKGGRPVSTVRLKLSTGVDLTGGGRQLLIDMWNNAHPETYIELKAHPGSTEVQKQGMSADAAGGEADILNLD